MNNYGLIGKSLKHSFSKKFFEEKFCSEELNATYENFELEAITDFPEFIERTPGLVGLNVTIPYKTQVMQFLHEISDEAQKIGAVNTIEFQNNRLIGHNTDAFGFQQSIKPFVRNIHERALVLGTGGASKAVAYVLTNLGIEVAFLSRTPNGPKEYAYADANALMMNAFKLIINTTPIGTFPLVNQCPPIPLDHFTEDHLVIDLIYNPEKTKLLAAAEKCGADTLNGISMLKQQALKSWEIWNQVDLK